MSVEDSAVVGKGKSSRRADALASKNDYIKDPNKKGLNERFEPQPH